RAEWHVTQALINSSRPGATGIFGSKCGSVRWWTVLAVCAPADQPLVPFEVGVSGSPLPACKPAMQSSASVEQKLRINRFTLEDLHLCLFNDVAHKAASIPQTGRLLFSRAIEGAHPQALFPARRRQPGKTPTAPGIFPQLRIELRHLPARSIIGGNFDTLNPVTAVKGHALYFERRSAGQLLAGFRPHE